MSCSRQTHQIPSIAIIPTLVSTVVKGDNQSIFERVILWGEPAIFLSSVLRSITKLSDKWGVFYERGFWNRAADGRISEVAILDMKEGEEVNDMIIGNYEDGNDSKGISISVIRTTGGSEY